MSQKMGSKSPFRDQIEFKRFFGKLNHLIVPETHGLLPFDLPPIGLPTSGLPSFGPQSFGHPSSVPRPSKEQSKSSILDINMHIAETN